MTAPRNKPRARRVMRVTCLNWPPASVGGDFPAQDVQFCPRGDALARSRGMPLAKAPSMQAATKRDASVTRFEDHQKPANPLTAGKDRQPESRAKEPSAIQRKAPWIGPGGAGGSSRRPATRLAGGWRSAVTASEATSRSGWKPRAFPLSGGQPLHSLRANRGQRCPAPAPGGAGVPSADAGDRPADRHHGWPWLIPGGPAGPGAFDMSGNPARPPRLRPGETTGSPAGGFGLGYPRTAAPLTGANQQAGAAA